MEEETITVRKMIMVFLHSIKCKRYFIFFFHLEGDPLYAPMSQSARALDLVLNLVNKLLNACLQIANMLWPSGQRLRYKVLVYSLFSRPRSNTTVWTFLFKEKRS